jgi:hypothetical protein
LSGKSKTPKLGPRKWVVWTEIQPAPASDWEGLEYEAASASALLYDQVERVPVGAVRAPRKRCGT